MVSTKPFDYNKSSFLQTHGVNQTYALKRVLAQLVRQTLAFHMINNKSSFLQLMVLTKPFNQQQVIIFANSWC